MNKIRLQVALATAGIASRRKSRELIEAGCVKVNGSLVNESGFRVDISKDKITLGKKPVRFDRVKRYYALNKPRGVLSTARDERGRKTVLDYISEKGLRLYPVGRLDKDTSGLIILTNDGDVTYRLTHPKFKIDRVYEVKASGNVSGKEAFRLKKGVVIEGHLARAEKVIFKKRSSQFTIIIITIREGRKREIRNMFNVIGHNVLELKRISYGPLELGKLKEGEIRLLTKGEVVSLKEKVGLK
ncbi:MAG: pseudouridine synthase [Candidatus Omnitrophota bacterium]